MISRIFLFGCEAVEKQRETIAKINYKTKEHKLLHLTLSKSNNSILLHDLQNVSKKLTVAAYLCMAIFLMSQIELQACH